ncbi:PhzF family phenazine biosynthesis protein [Actinomadura macrotermitis]|uniref:Trans-2,3-dihydro-3-hydroxyanthranilate isomerase n=1 Tax=Actinomadura macrotermitis TaxID=2585200 RepID=A0A7K0C0X5_9ACTN|nr:PhzF family phenazine biosynthesis protein [Actinomadura macrotermitis]MQY06454.1 Trans-2,3-dihydro-3-hydroxyanthranilate isomerase [Actinomadura macrotermitis]
MRPYQVVDAFADTPLRGNPVAVFFDAGNLPAETMQRIAQEMNLSEVTFVLPPETGGDARIRIFTPVNELPFAGHPLLGTAVALGAAWGRDRLRLETARATVPVRLTDLDPAAARAGAPVTAWMDQPLPTWRACGFAAELCDALGLGDKPVDLPVELYDNGPRHVLVHCRDLATLSALRPDLRALAELPEMAANCFAADGPRWRMRMFSPAYGVAEDAATGSAAGPLAVHLARYGLADYGERVEIAQGVEMGRHARMLAVAHGCDERLDRVEVGGPGVVVAHGTFHV